MRSCSSPTAWCAATGRRWPRSGWGLVVADEAQHAKNPHSRTARELRAIPSAARVALSGTPVENRLSELWALLDWTTPGLLGSLEGFRRTLAVPVERYRDPAATERLARIVRPFLLRRRKSDPGIAPELPAKTETDRVVPLSTEQATLYAAVVAETLAKIADRRGHRPAGARAGPAHRAQADLQPPRAVSRTSRGRCPGARENWLPWTSWSRSSSPRASRCWCSASTSR